MADGLGPGTLSLPGIEDLELIGRGGSATLYRGRQAAFHRDVAVKVLDTFDDGAAARFSKELRAIGSMSGHRHVVAVYDAGELDGHPYLVMPFLSGGSLADRMRAGPLPPAEVRTIGLAVAEALSSAHALGMLHRDVKPANVLFNAYGEAQLADFGIARFSDATQTHGLVSATVGYAAPEILAGESASPAADVYSLGVTLHAALRGVPPYLAQPDELAIAFAVRVMQSEPPPLHGIPTALAAIVGKAMAKNPAERYPTAAAMRMALMDADLTILAPVQARTQTQTTERFSRPLVAPHRSSRRLLAGAIAVAVLAVVVAVLAMTSSGRPTSRPDAGRSGPATTASPSRAATGPATTTATTSAPTPTAVPATTVPAPASTAGPTGSSAAPATTASTTPPAGSGSGSLDTYVRSYYDLVNAHSLPQAWTWLTPAYQQRLGYAYYQQFWDSVRSVDVVTVIPGTDQATVTLRYTMANGTIQTETARLGIVTANGRQLIDNTQVVA